MRLTRRDAMLALGAGGVGAVLGGAAGTLDRGRDTTSADEEKRDIDGSMGTIVAVAEVVFPSELEGIDEFVETYVRRLPAARQAVLADTVAKLDRYTRQKRGQPFETLSASARDETLRTMGVAREGSDPDGTLPERVRYHVVNQLLLGLYTSPRGSSLAGIQNPRGHPGGFESYQRPPQTEQVTGDNRGS